MTMTVQSSLIQVLINRETPFNSFRCKQTILFDIKGPASDDVSNIFSTDLLEVKKNEDMYCNRSVFNRAQICAAGIGNSCSTRLLSYGFHGLSTRCFPWIYILEQALCEEKIDTLARYQITRSVSNAMFHIWYVCTL